MPKNIYDLVAFQRALDLVVAVRSLSSRFPGDERYGLTIALASLLTKTKPRFDSGSVRVPRHSPA